MEGKVFAFQRLGSTILMVWAEIVRRIQGMRARTGPREQQGLVVLVSYEGMRLYLRQILLDMGTWDAVVVDEGQVLRNPETEISTVCRLLPSYHRLILSGTPIQNSLRELWSLMDFVYPNLLGDIDSFDRDFATPIRSGNYKNSSLLAKEIAIRTAIGLQRIIAPYLLRRKKNSVSIASQLPKKTEQVLFCKLSPVQRTVYLNTLSSSEVRKVLEKKAPAFRAITTLRKICNHPALAFHKGTAQWTVCEDSAMSWRDSSKLVILSKILPVWSKEGHKVLIFSQSHSMLNLVEGMLRQLAGDRRTSSSTNSPFYTRLDGTTPPERREQIIHDFNSEPAIFAMLLTTRTGGVGISLTAANKVIIVDPDWNPQTDIQARERAWRIGQRREVTVYRLITRGTIEEKIYKRQIFKLLLTSRILDNPRQVALFCKSDIHDLFALAEEEGGSGSTLAVEVLDEDGRVVKRNAVSKANNGFFHGDNYNILNDLPSEGQWHSSASKSPGPAEEGEVVEEEYDQIMQHSVYLDPTSSLMNNAQAASEENLKSIEAMFGVDLVLREESSDADLGGAAERDRDLLQVLMDGEDVTAVYDHAAVEPKDAANQLSSQRIKEFAKQTVNRTLTGLLGANVPSLEMTTAAPASSDMLSRLRMSSAGITVQSHTEGPAEEERLRRPIQRQIATPPAISTRDTIKTKIERLLRPRPEGVPTAQILQAFSYLSDVHAPLFKSMLQSVAYCLEGRWHLK